MKKYFVKLLLKGDLWRITSLEPIISYIEKLIVKNNLPVLVNNPDLFAMNNAEGYDKPIPTITPGSVGKYLKEKGLEVIEFGKPYKEIYDYTISKIKNYTNKEVDKSRICMVGDTLRTDIKGANNIGIKSVLCLKTGITANEIDKGAKLEKLIKNKGVVVDYFINSVSGAEFLAIIID